MGDVTPDTLRELRQRLGAAENKDEISQAELARRIGANNVTVWRWEKGIAAPRGVAVAALRRLMLGVDMNGHKDRAE